MKSSRIRYSVALSVLAIAFSSMSSACVAFGLLPLMAERLLITTTVHGTRPPSVEKKPIRIQRKLDNSGPSFRFHCSPSVSSTRCRRCGSCWCRNLSCQLCVLPCGRSKCHEGATNTEKGCPQQVYWWVRCGHNPSIPERELQASESGLLSSTRW